MAHVQVFINDQIRGQHLRLHLDSNRRIAILIDALVKDFGLPRRNFRQQPLEYRLVRLLDGRVLPPNRNLYELGVANREILHLVCPQARETWTTIQEILDQIESEITDHASGKVKERVTEKVWSGVKQKLEQLEQTHSDDPRLKQIRRWVETVDVYGGPSFFQDLAEKITEPFSLKAIGFGLVKIILAVGLSIVTYRVADASLAYLFPEKPTTVVENPPPQITIATDTAPTPTPATSAAVLETEAVATPVPPTPIPPTPIVVTPEPPSPTPCVYPANWVKIVVQPGDTLRNLAHTYDSSVKGLMEANCLTGEPLAGSELYVPYIPTRTATPRPVYQPPVYCPPIRTYPQRPKRTPETPPVEPVQTEPPVQHTEPPVQHSDPPLKYVPILPQLLPTLPPLQQYRLLPPGDN
jgi:LysM repeat protein